MPEILKDKDGNTSWSAIFMGFAMAAVLIMQQYQTMHIAEIKTQAEVNQINFMDKDEIHKIQDDINKRINYTEQHTIPKDVVIRMLEAINNRLSELEHVNNIKHDPSEEENFRKELK